MEFYDGPGGPNKSRKIGIIHVHDDGTYNLRMKGRKKPSIKDLVVPVTKLLEDPPRMADGSAEDSPRSADGPSH